MVSTFHLTRTAKLPWRTKDTETQSRNHQTSAFFVPSCLRGESATLPDWHLRELDQSLAEYELNPREGRPWPEIRDRLLAQHQL